MTSELAVRAADLGGVSDLLALTLPRLELFMMALARTAGLFLMAPILGSRMVPVRVRAALVFFISLAMLPALPADAAAPFAANAGATMVVAGIVLELGIGCVIGLIAELIFGGVQMAGQLAGIQIGLGIANLFDPQTQDHVTSLSQWQNLMALLAFLAMDGHHLLIRAVAQSFVVLPLGGVPSTAGLGRIFLLAGGIFVVALKVAAPVLVLLLLVNGAMAVLSKLIPQLNVFIVGFPLNIAAGLLILAAAEPFTLQILENAFAEMGNTLAAAMQGLR